MIPAMGTASKTSKNISSVCYDVSEVYSYPTSLNEVTTRGTRTCED